MWGRGACISEREREREKERERERERKREKFILQCGGDKGVAIYLYGSHVQPTKKAGLVGRFLKKYLLNFSKLGK